MRLCSGTGCGRKVPDHVRLCYECRSERGEQPTDSKAHSTAYDAVLDGLRKGGRWQRVRERVVKKQPMCAKCDTAPTEIVDHIVPAAIAIQQTRESGRYPFDPNAGYYLQSNLQGLCRSCHFHKTNEDKAHVGPWPSVLEAEDKAPKKVWSF